MRGADHGQATIWSTMIASLSRAMGDPCPGCWPTKPDGTIHVPVKARHIISHGDALRDAVLSGAGLAFLSTWLAGNDLRKGRLESVLTSAGVDDMPMHALWPRSRDLAPKIRVVVDEQVKRFLPIPPWER